MNGPVRSRPCQDAGDRLRAQLELGVDALRRGDFDEVDPAAFHIYLEALTGRRGARRHVRIASPARVDAATQRRTSGKKRQP